MADGAVEEKDVHAFRVPLDGEIMHVVVVRGSIHSPLKAGGEFVSRGSPPRHMESKNKGVVEG